MPVLCFVFVFALAAVRLFCVCVCRWLDKKAQGGLLFQQEYEAQEKEYVQSAQKEEDN